MTRPGVLALSLLLAGCSGAVAHLGPSASSDARLVHAEALMRAGQYPEARETYQQVLDANPPTREPDRALFGLARWYAASDNPFRDDRQAYEHVDRLVRAYPQSRWSDEARAWRELLATALSLRGQLSEARREADRLRREAQRERQERERLQRDLEQLKQQELELERAHP